MTQESPDLSRSFEVKVTKLKFLFGSFAVTNHSLNIYSLLQVRVVAKTIKGKKNNKTVKEKLLKSLKENDTVEESDFDIKNIVD